MSDIDKAKWHWRCRWFSHTYWRTGGGKVYGPFAICQRCGFNPGGGE